MKIESSCLITAYLADSPPSRTAQKSPTKHALEMLLEVAV